MENKEFMLWGLVIICIWLFLNGLVISKTIRTNKYINAGYTQEIVPIQYETIWVKN